MNKPDKDNESDNASEYEKWAINRIRQLESTMIKEAALILKERSTISDESQAERLRLSANRIVDMVKRTS